MCLDIEPKVDLHDRFYRLRNNQFSISQCDQELEINYASSYSNDTNYSTDDERENSSVSQVNSTTAMKIDKPENSSPKNLKLNTDLINEKNHTPAIDEY